jgi:hypothetical protein
MAISSRSIVPPAITLRCRRRSFCCGSGSARRPRYSTSRTASDAAAAERGDEPSFPSSGGDRSHEPMDPLPRSAGVAATPRSVRMLDLRFKPSLAPIGASFGVEHTSPVAEACLVSRGRRCLRRPWAVWIWLDADTSGAGQVKAERGSIKIRPGPCFHVLTRGEAWKTGSLGLDLADT